MKDYPLPLYIVGLNIDKETAHYNSRKGRLENVLPNVYLNTDLTPADRLEVMTKNAARMVCYAYDNIVLTGPSAFHRGAVEGQLFVANASGGKPVDAGGAFTIFFTRSNVQVGMMNEVEHVSIEDAFGPYTVKRLSDEMLILKNFQMQRGRPRASYLNAVDLTEVVDRSIRVHGTRENLMRRLEVLAGHHGLSHYLKQVRSFVDTVGNYKATARPLEEYNVFWHDKQVAKLQHDGYIWSFDYDRNCKLHLSVNESAGKRATPSFLASLLPETGKYTGGTLEESLAGFKSAHRYISNITVLPAGETRKSIIIDQLEGELTSHMSHKLEFNGKVDSMLLQSAEDGVLMADMQENPYQPRLSGVQVKLATNLSTDGVLSAASGKSFTHILKIPNGAAVYASLGSMEWFSLTVAMLNGLNTEKFSLLELPGSGPGLLVERFDIRRDFNDKRLILTEDFWSVFGMRDPAQKYRGELMQVADELVKCSTDIRTDGRNLLSQAIFSWLTFNGDMHLKNLLLLKESDGTEDGFNKVCLSPMYDMLCTQVYPDDFKTAAIQLCGSSNHTLAGFRALGKKFGMMTDEVDAMADYLASSIPLNARRVAENLPQAIQDHALSMEHIKRAQALFELRCMMMIAELDGAKKSRTADKADDEAAQAASTSFSADVSDDDVEEHLAAERRRSWVPVKAPAEGAQAKPATTRPTARPRP